MAVVLALLLPRPALSTERKLVSSVAAENNDGPDAQIIRAVARRLDTALVIRHAPFKRRLQLMKDGEIDFMPGLLKRPEREVYIHYLPVPYKERSDTIFIVHRDRASRIRTYEDLYSLRIGTILGSKYFPRFDGDPRLDKEAVATGASNIRKLLMDRIDAVVYPESAGIELIHNLGIEDRVALADFRFAGEKHVFIGVSRKSPLMDRIDAFEAVVGAMIASGEIRSIIVDYYVRRNLPIPAL
ncbi:MAG TPA: transporter substrate-binding domain-containing protein [Desulfosarcina sp.]|nr:transporter substrate-binding domain-containing protein [Desulfosarcina sp.]